MVSREELKALGANLENLADVMTDFGSVIHARDGVGKLMQSEHRGLILYLVTKPNEGKPDGHPMKLCLNLDTPCDDFLNFLFDKLTTKRDQIIAHLIKQHDDLQAQMLKIDPNTHH